MTPKRQRAKPTTPEKYLWQRGNVLWFRYSVPARYRSVESRRLVQQSLGTPDGRAASVLAGKVRADLHSTWEAKLSGALSSAFTTPSVLELQLAATETAYLRIQPKLDAFWASKALDTAEAYQANLGSGLIRATR
ncbi:DUF6538 domain-containing protein [Alteripontixanthobacter muriae]|uniref:DUF6538 domain-containing protein n=1 Tax=Alteripontixanthobacter muriae TaxID=2705546 RepID=UPI0038BA4313